LKVEPGSKSTAAAARTIAIRIAATGASHDTVFNGTEQTFDF
jgi:hypothetical protein